MCPLQSPTAPASRGWTGRCDRRAVRLLRSWPATIPAGRSYVVDGIERLLMDDYDYRCLADVDDDLVLIEWDIAIGAGELAMFMARAAAEPGRVRVAPYLLYQKSSRPRALYAHRDERSRWVRYGDPFCYRFGFGLVYLPRPLVEGFMSDPRNKKLTDTTFSHWHLGNARCPEVPIEWDCHAVHLHYELPEVPSVSQFSDRSLPTPSG